MNHHLDTVATPSTIAATSKHFPLKSFRLGSTVVVHSVLLLESERVQYGREWD